MGTALFEDVIFGPLESRRFGNSLGINLLPEHVKFCNFNCIYCECGWTENEDGVKNKLPGLALVISELIKKVERLKDRNIPIDNITFAGNGEPTLHPKFAEVIKDVLLVRDIFLPNSKVAVLTNASMMHKDEVKNALSKVETCMFKLDAGTEEMFRDINQPLGGLTLAAIVRRIKEFGEEPIIQSMFLRGTINDKKVDNTTPEEIEAWIGLLKELAPSNTVIYSIDRATPAKGIEKISKEELEKIAMKVHEAGLTCTIA